MKKFWFEKYIGCAFNIKGIEYIFSGTYENTETKNGKPYQYVFEADNAPQYLTDYKEARCIMGAMIERYTYNRKEF
jgi:hypothetical protein